MKQFLGCVVLALCGWGAAAQDYRAYDLSEVESDPRLFFTNFTSSLIQVNGTLLAYGLIGLAVLGAAAVAFYYLYLESQNTSSAYGSTGGYGDGYSNYNYANARSSQEGYGLSGGKILQWIAMLKEVYEKFDYNDIECQKKLICEVMKEPSNFGTAAMKFKEGFEAVKIFELFSLPDEMQELLDEYLDANSRADSNKGCEEYFECPYSIKESVKRNFSGNNLY